MGVSLSYFPSFSEGLSLRACWIRVGRAPDPNFPSFSEGLSLRAFKVVGCRTVGGADFPSFSEGLSLRDTHGSSTANRFFQFPFLFGGTFIEGHGDARRGAFNGEFPFLFGGTFIEGPAPRARSRRRHFPSFSEGLSLRGLFTSAWKRHESISLPFRRDFH